MSLTLIKLGYLFLRTVAKPISGVVRNQAIKRESFRNACENVAQNYHVLEVRMRRRLRNAQAKSDSVYGAAVKPLDPAKAVEMGSNFIAEVTVFSLVGLAIVLESRRTRASKRSKTNALNERIAALSAEVAQIKQKLHEMQKPAS